jgi:ABC-type lipoprotein release transport system permease subunit
VARASGLLLALTATLCCTPSALSAQSPTANAPGILISRQLAESEHLSVGSTVRLATRADASSGREFRVAGIYEPTPDPARLGSIPREVRLHLPDLLDLMREPGPAEAGHYVEPAGSESVDGINIALTTPDDADAFVRDVNARMPGIRAIRADRAGDTVAFDVLERFHLAIAGVTIAAATVFLLALTIMLVDERRETVGVLRLIGLPVRRILVQILIEGLLVASLGAIFGLLLAFLSQGAINRFFQWRYDTTLVFVGITPRVAMLCVWIAVPLGASATVVASWALLRRNALRLVRR